MRPNARTGLICFQSSNVVGCARVGSRTLPSSVRACSKRPGRSKIIIYKPPRPCSGRAPPQRGGVRRAALSPLKPAHEGTPSPSHPPRPAIHGCYGPPQAWPAPPVAAAAHHHRRRLAAASSPPSHRLVAASSPPHRHLIRLHRHLYRPPDRRRRRQCRCRLRGCSRSQSRAIAAAGEGLTNRGLSHVAACAA